MASIATPKSDIAARFQEDGYYVARGVFSPSEVAELESEFDRIVRQITGAGEETNARWGGAEMERLGAVGKIVTHTHNVQQFSAVWLRALLHPGFLAVATEILGPDVVLHHSKLFQKPAENGAPFPMHQDWSYFPTVRDTMMAGIIHVSAATDAMGCLRVYPGSHKRGRIENSNGTKDGVMTTDYPIVGATPMECAPGDVVFFHYLTVHGSMPNTSDATRKTVLVQMLAGDDRV
ncbi:phytanoyl-CoA dioxygenase family protein, partial [bacterium]